MNIRPKVAVRNCPPTPPLHYRGRYGRREFGAGINLPQEAAIRDPTIGPATCVRTQIIPVATQSGHLSGNPDTGMTPPPAALPGPQAAPAVCVHRE